MPSIAGGEEMNIEEMQSIVNLKDLIMKRLS
jgi:hypothetical protein